MPTITKVVSSNPAHGDRVLDRTYIWDTVYQWLAIGRWYSPGIPVSVTNKTDHWYNWNIVENGVEHYKPKPYFIIGKPEYLERKRVYIHANSFNHSRILYCTE